MDRIHLTRLSLAADYYRNLKVQVGAEMAMSHTVQRYAVLPREVEAMMAHEDGLKA